ncbi:hypothetical protein H4R99_002287 [Coemansia sp. RSA 1722]|nr:hypothetical protein LPJ57_000606 [Coemansia sp. RSA 486]KAJ2228357.1 hypothetical protein IWW45_006639 [Coemansia sp. RSA 485]KAJ2601553.1 hypothetical protein GGF39_001194 [Coemansia sp. RSA 1721]KAJ2603673.1 hypothetical protein H4R99_002287 [Coemansia sp. RSA 1722]KAJ2639364.1 hypothetical protein GGF40_000922 [Coemansia sp. RSA 1286]
MGQPRLRLVNKEPEDHDDVTPPVSPRNIPSTPATTSRPKRVRKSEIHADATQPSGAGAEVGSAYAQMKEKCLQLYQAIKELEKDGELMCLAFNKLPPKKEYPDYYVEIKQPIALDIIKGRITRNLYKSVSDFVSDVDLMCNNAQQYNMPDSYIYDVAGEIRTNVQRLAADALSKEKSTAATSSTGSGSGAAVAGGASTPAAKSATPILKLKIRQPTVPEQSAPTSGEGSVGLSAVNDKIASTSTPKRKRTKEPASTIAAPEAGAANIADASKSSKSKSSRSTLSSEVNKAIDELFQAIYDADLGAALKILDTPDLPLNEYRKVVLKEQEAISDIETNDSYTWAPLHAAACYGRLKVAQVLCDKGADIEAIDTMHKSTPLAWAAYTGRKRLAKCLVRVYKANVNTRNAHDQLPIQIVLDPQNPKWAEFLMPTDGSKVDLPPPEEESSPEAKKTPAKRAKARASVDFSAPIQTPTGGSSLPGLAASLPAMVQQANAGLSAMSVSTPLVPGPSSGQQSPAPSIPSSGPPIPQCIGGIGHQEVVHPQMSDAMKEIVACVVDYKDEDDNRLAEVFEDLPDREEYPEYYDVIVHPMALNLVKARITAGYRSFDAFNYDMSWIFNNATFFNESDSQIYQDAVVLESEYKRICRETVKKYSIPFDTSYNDAVAPEGRYVSRVTAGDHDIFVGDFIYVRSGTEMRIAMVTRLRVGGAYDRRKFIDGRWLLKPTEIPELAGQLVYPHQLFAGPEFDSHGVRGISGKCFVLLPNVYSRVYPQGYAAQDIFVCESIYVKPEDGSQPGSFKPISNWAHSFKTPLMRPPTFIQYIVPFSPVKRPIEGWNNTNLLPHMGMTMLNRDAARIHEQAQARSRGLAQQKLQQQQVLPQNGIRPLIQSPVPISGAVQMPTGTTMAMSMSPQVQAQLQMRPPNVQSPIPQATLTQNYQSLTARHQQSLANLQAQMTQYESTIRKQINDQVFALQQQNPNFVGSPQHQSLLKQQSQAIEQTQQGYFAKVHQLQQTYNQNVQALNQTMQQQQQAGMMQPMSPMLNVPHSAGGGVFHGQSAVLANSPAMNAMAMSSPMARPAQVIMTAPMSPLGAMPMVVSGAIPANMIQTSMTAIPNGAVNGTQPGMVRPAVSGVPTSFASMVPATGAPQHMINGNQVGIVDRSMTPGHVPNGSPAGVHPGMSSPLPPGANAQAMMNMLIQQQQNKQNLQQQQQQQQPLQQYSQANQNTVSAPKQTATPLSPNIVGSPVSSTSAVGQNGHPPPGPNSGLTPTANAAQSQQALETWKKITRVFTTHGNSRISRDLGIQFAAPDSSMFLHIALSDVESNHALCVPQSASSILLRPVPGPLNNGKTLLVLSANGRRYLPRVIADNSAQLSDNGINEDSRSLASDDNEKDDAASIGALIRSANYAYEVPIQTGMNFVDVEVLVSDWKAETFLSDNNADQQVPPAQSPSTETLKQVSKHYMFFLTRT